MNFPFFIARRYLFSKKSTNAINVISAISVVGVAVATMALVVTLSVFNGFHDLVASFFTSFDPQLKVVPMKGKTVAADDPVLTQIRQLPQIEVATECVEDQALAIYNGHQATVMVKGVDDNFNQLTRINEILVGDGEFGLHAAGMDYGILGIQLAEQLHTGYAYDHPLKVYAPRREGQFDITNPEAAFEEDELYSPGVLFNVKQAKYDKSYIITSIAFARRLFGQQGMLSSLELRLKPGSNFDAVKSEIQRLCGDQFTVRDRFEQQDDTFKIMKIEKFIAYIFLTFILMVLPLRGQAHLRHRSRHRYPHRPVALLASAAVWYRGPRLHYGQFRHRCLSRQRPPRRHRAHLRHGAHRRLPRRLVSCPLLRPPIAGITLF